MATNKKKKFKKKALFSLMTRPFCGFRKKKFQRKKSACSEKLLYSKQLLCIVTRELIGIEGDSDQFICVVFTLMRNKNKIYIRVKGSLNTKSSPVLIFILLSPLVWVQVLIKYWYKKLKKIFSSFCPLREGVKKLDFLGDSSL